MVAGYSSVSPGSWRPTARTLGSLFAGSAMALTATVVHGGSPPLAGDKAGSTAPPSASPTVTESLQLPPRSSTASLPGPGHAAPWEPGAAPQWGSPLRDLPVRRAPVREAPRQGVPASTASVTAPSARPASSGTFAAGPTAPRHDANGARTGNDGLSGAAPQTADPQLDRSFAGLLSSILQVTKGLRH